MDNKWNRLPESVRNKIETLLNSHCDPSTFDDTRIVSLMETMPEDACIAALNELSTVVGNRQTPIHNPRAYFYGIVSRIEKKTKIHAGSSQSQLPPSVLSKLQEFESLGFCTLSEIDDTGLYLLSSLPEHQSLRVLDEVKSVGRGRIRNLSAFIVSICRRMEKDEARGDDSSSFKRARTEDVRQVPHYSNWHIMNVYQHGMIMMPHDLRFVKASNDPMYDDEYCPMGVNPYPDLDPSLSMLLSRMTERVDAVVTNSLSQMPLDMAVFCVDELLHTDMKTIKSSPVAYLKGIIKRVAERQGINLNYIKTKSSNNDDIASEIDRLVHDGRTRSEDFDANIISILQNAPRHIAMRVLFDYAGKDKSKIKNATGFVRGMIKKALERDESS